MPATKNQKGIDNWMRCRQPMMLQIMDQETLGAKEDRRARALTEIITGGQGGITPKNV